MVCAKSAGILERMMNEMIRAIVPIIGPIAFSTNEEKRNARDATHHMLTVASANANDIRQSNSLAGMIVMILPTTRSGPEPNRAIPKPRHAVARNATSVNE